jgi:rhamnose transport system substrate-binding protein
MKDFILDGSCPAMQLWNPPYEGYLAVYLAQAIVENGFEIKSGASFEAGKLKTYTFNDTNQVITLPSPMTYDQSNIEEYAALF